PTTEDTEIPAAKALSSRFVNVPVPGPWLRLTALVASAGTLLAVVSGASGLDAAHRVLAALAVPPLLAIVAAAWLTHRRLLPTSVAAMVGLAFACGGASALNHVLDRDIDRLMGDRTRARPLAADRMPVSLALEFGLALTAFSFVLLASAVNVLTAALALVGNLFYV